MPAFHVIGPRTAAHHARRASACAGLALALGLLLVPAAPAQFIGGYGESWIACGKQYPNERKADKAVARCAKTGFSCEEVAARGIVSLRKGRMASAPLGYEGPWGVVVVEIEFDEAGHHASARILNTPSATLSRQSLAAIETWDVYPSCPGGTPVRQTAKMPIHFSVAE